MGIKQILEAIDAKRKHIADIELDEEELIEEHEPIAH